MKAGGGPTVRLRPKMGKAPKEKSKAVSLHKGAPKFLAYLRQGTIAPYVSEENHQSDPWVWFGTSNLYPEKIRSLVDNCAPAERSAIMLSQFIAGSGIRFLNKAGDEVEAAQKLFQSWMGSITEEEFLLRTAYDLALGLGKAWMVRRGAGGGIVFLDHIDVVRLRSGVLEKGRVNKFFWSSNWERYQSKKDDARYTPEELKAFDKTKMADRAVLYTRIYKQNRDYYSEPFWMGAIQAAEVWTKIDNYNKVQIDTGFAPAVFITSQFEGSDVEVDAYDKAFEEAFIGSMGQGVIHVPFGPGETPPTVTKLERGNHAGELDEIANRCADVIYDAFGIPSLLMRDRQDGLTSQGEAVHMRLQQFQRTVVEPMQKYITRDLTMLMNAAGLTDVWEAKIDPLDVFDIQQSDDIVMASKTVDEARKQRGDDEAEDTEWGKTPLAKVKAPDPRVDGVSPSVSVKDINVAMLRAAEHNGNGRP